MICLCILVKEGLPLHINLLFQDLDAMEGAQLGLEAVVGAIFDGSVDYGKIDLETKSQLQKIFEGSTQPKFILDQLLGSTVF